MNYDEMNYNELADEVARLKKEQATLKAQSAEITKALDAITIKIIPEKLAEDGFRSVNLANGGQIKLSPQAYCSTRAGMKGELFNWLQENDFPELITEVVNPSTLKAFVREQALAGNPVPPDTIVNYDPYMRASVVGVK